MNVVPRHLVYVITEDWFFASHFLDRAKAAVGKGYKVSVITRCRETAREFRQYGLAQINIEFSRRGLNPITELITIFRLRTILKRIRPDIVHNIGPDSFENRTQSKNGDQLSNRVESTTRKLNIYRSETILSKLSCSFTTASYNTNFVSLTNGGFCSI